jgi:hypothetical protein
MKNLIVALVLVLGMTSFAQDKKERPSRQEMENSLLNKEIN